MCATHLDLFSGIGGFSLAFESEGFRTVGFSEVDPDASLVLAHHWPPVRNFGDIRTIGTGILAETGPIDVITGGVPCQPASALGQMRGTADERWLWPEAIRVVSEIRPRFALFENPPSLLRLENGRAWDGIVNGLAALGYDCWWDVVPAAVFGAGHIRERVFLVAADSTDRRCERERILLRGEPHEDSKTQWSGESGNTSNGDGSGRGERRAGRLVGDCERQAEQPLRVDVTHGHSERQRSRIDQSGTIEERSRVPKRFTPPDLRGRVSSENWWHENVTGIPVLVHGLSGRLAESACRCTGNAVVPQAAQIYARAIRKMITA